MAFQRTARRAKDLSASINWDKILNGPVRPHPNVALLRSQVAKVNANVALYSQPPAPIDWAAYKSKMRDPLYVELMQKQLAGMEYDTKSVEDVSALYNVQEVEANWAQMLKELSAEYEESAAELVFLDEDLAKRKRTRTTLDTTVADLLKEYPELEEEIDDEIANHDWEKDVE
eukprot:11424-Heterococcus_DN1.PRE.1